MLLIPAALENVPGGHNKHWPALVPPVTLVYVPAWQARHLKLLVAPISVEKLPAGHATQLELTGMAWPEEYVPAEHDWQALAREAETVVENVPGGQAKQYSPVLSRPYRYSSSNIRLFSVPASLLTTKPMYKY